METGRQLRCKADCRHGCAHALVNLGLRQFHVGRAVGNVLRDGLLEQLVLRVLEHQTGEEAEVPDLLRIFPQVAAIDINFAAGSLFRPFMWVMRVLLPEPVAPMMPTKSPSSTVKLTSSSAVTALGMPGL